MDSSKKLQTILSHFMKRILSKHRLIPSIMLSLLIGLASFFIAITFAIYYFQPNESDVTAILVFACSFTLIVGLPSFPLLYLTVTKNDEFYAKEKKRNGE